MLSAGAVDVPKAYANKAKDRPPVTTKTLPETAKATTKTGGGTDTPLWKQRIVVNIKTGERTTIEDVMARKTAATSTINGMPAPGGGYYYTPGPANRPVTVSTSGAAAGTTVSGSNGLGFINQDMMGGSMILLSGASLFQPLANFGGGKEDDEVCLECAKQGPSTPPVSDPNLPDENTVPPEIRPGYELLVPIFNELGEFPFTVDGTYNAEYFAALYDVLMREPFSELSNLAKDEMAGYCPNYSNLNDLQKKALVMLMFSNMMKNKNGKYEPRRIVESGSEKGYGLCGIRPEFAQSRLQEDYRNVIKNRGTYQVTSSQVGRSSYALQDFGVAYNSVEDLYHAQNNIRLCVMEMHYTAVIHTQNTSGEVKPFTHKMEFLSDTATKEKFKNYSLCKTASGGDTPPAEGGGAVIN